ncbi:MAG: hypothetical protein ABJA90_12190 [Ginsengibacter sp.]
MNFPGASLFASHFALPILLVKRGQVMGRNKDICTFNLWAESINFLIPINFILFSFASVSRVSISVRKEYLQLL